MVTEPINDNEVPVSYEKVVSRKNGTTWKRAIELEMKSLKKLKTQELVWLPPGWKVVQT